MAITKVTKLIVGLLATGGVSGGVAGGYYLLKPKATESSSKALSNGQTTEAPSTITSDSNQNSDRSDATAKGLNPSPQGLSGSRASPANSASIQQPPTQSSEGDRGATGPLGASA